MKKFSLFTVTLILFMYYPLNLISQGAGEIEPNNDLTGNCNPIITANGSYYGSVPWDSLYLFGDIDIWKICPGSSGLLSAFLLIVPDGSQVSGGLYESDSPDDLGTLLGSSGDYELFYDKYYFLYTAGNEPILPGAVNGYSWQLSGDAFDTLCCLPDGITFTTQAQIDNFQANYPGCIIIEGDVEISGNDITNLISLNVLISIGGYLYIANNNTLVNLAGLESLASIGGNLIFYNNQCLPNVTGLGSLTTISGDLGFIENPAFLNMVGFEALTSVGGKLDLLGNPVLISLTGFDELISIGGQLQIVYNEALTSLAGLNALNSISGFLIISGNSSLTGLSGLDNLNYNSIAYLTIENNIVLSDCDVQSICEYLAEPGASGLIYNNADGCNSQAQVLEACLTSMEEYDAEDEISLFPNPAKNTITVLVNRESQIEEITIYNQLGQKVLVGRLENNNMDISKLQQGMYIMEVAIKNWKIRKILMVK